MSDLFGSLAHTEQRTLLFNILKIIAGIHLNSPNDSNLSEEQVIISAAAGILRLFVADDRKYLTYLVTWLTSATGAGLGDAIGIRRAVLAVISSDRDTMATVFEKSLSQFGDYLYIRHTPVLQQEGMQDGIARSREMANTWGHSACTSTSAERWLSPKAGAGQAISDREVRHIHEYGFQEAGSISDPRPPAGNDSW